MDDFIECKNLTFRNVDCYCCKTMLVLEKWDDVSVLCVKCANVNTLSEYACSSLTPGFDAAEVGFDTNGGGLTK